MLEPSRKLEINGGRVEHGKRYLLKLQAGYPGYSDAQIDDYGGRRRKDFLWEPGTNLSLRAKFSHSKSDLVGTAGFGFWNVPFGDPTVFWPALPRAVWFFYASHPSDLPLAKKGPGRGWFVSTIDAMSLAAIYLAPFTLPIVLLNHISRVRNWLWPIVQERLKISFSELENSMTQWHFYQLEWGKAGCRFWIDNNLIASTNLTPKGPLGFVCWIDNQYLCLTNTGRLRWGTLSVPQEQWLEVEDLQISRF